MPQCSVPSREADGQEGECADIASRKEKNRGEERDQAPRVVETGTHTVSGELGREGQGSKTVQSASAGRVRKRGIASIPATIDQDCLSASTPLPDSSEGHDLEGVAEVGLDDTKGDLSELESCRYLRIYTPKRSTKDQPPQEEN